MDSDDEVLVVDAPRAAEAAMARGSPQRSARASGGGEGVGSDEELQVVGRTGCNSLGDFPHPRHICPARAFVQGGATAQNAAFCAKCFCYVCDIAGQCGCFCFVSCAMEGAQGASTANTYFWRTP